MSNPWSQSYENLRNSIDEASTAYLEKDMKKRQKNNEKARKEMEKMGSMKNPHFGSGPTGSMSSEGYGAPGHNPGSGEKSVARAKALMDKKGQKGAPGLDAMAAAKKEHEARRGVKKEEVAIDEADSLAAMQARREKRLAAQRKREGTTATGRDFGHDYSLTPAQQKKRREDEFKAGIGTKKEEAEGMHRDAKTGEVVKKAEVGKIYYPNMPKKKTSVALRKEKMKEGLDPVGQEDKDIDNDGDHDKSDKYLAKRRKAIGKAMKNQKEDWRSSLGFIDEAGCSGDDMEDKKDMKKIGKGEVKNKINVMPNVKMGKQNESANLCPVCGYEPCQCPPEQRTEALQVPQQENPKRQQKMSQAAAQYSKSKKKSADFPTEELDFYLDNNAKGSLWQRVKEASWDMKTGKSKDPKKRAEAAQKAAEMKARDKRAGRRTYGSAKLGYAKKDWDE